MTDTIKKIVIAPDKFKGTYTAVTISNLIAQELIIGFSGDIILCPMADGGEGSQNVIENALLGQTKIHKVKTVDSLGRIIESDILIYNEGQTAFIEAAQTIGLTILDYTERNPDNTTSYGLGIVINHIINNYKKVNKIRIAIGGVSTNEAGIGMLSALGYSFKLCGAYDSMAMCSSSSYRLSPKNSQVSKILQNITEIIPPKDSCLLSKIVAHKLELEILCDVRNPLLGINGATIVFSGQKGADTKLQENFEQGMINWTKVVKNYISHNHTQNKISNNHNTDEAFPYSGAAGGLGYTFHNILGAELQNGFDEISKLTGLDEQISTADIVISGEGALDRQSLNGKVPIGVAQICLKYSKPLIIVCGKNKLSYFEYHKAGISKVLTLMEIAKVPFKERFQLITNQ